MRKQLQDIREWHRVFAWWPVVTIDGRRVWWEHVERRYRFSSWWDDYYEFRAPLPLHREPGRGSVSAWPEIEYEESYPVDEDFAEITSDSPPPSFKDAGAWLLRELPRAAENMTCFCKVTRGKDRITGKPVCRVTFSTYGWSGAESIIRLIERRVDLNYHMVSWRRGGHYTFEVKVEPSARPVADVRKQAWATRRAKYGAHGHAGGYSRTIPTQEGR